jgi:hypothetical protein
MPTSPEERTGNSDIAVEPLELADRRSVQASSNGGEAH